MDKMSQWRHGLKDLQHTYSLSKAFTSRLFFGFNRITFPGVLRTILFAFVISGALFSKTWAWQYEAITQVAPGQKASISIVAPSDLKKVLITLKSNRSKRVIKKRLRSLSAHKGHKVTFKPPKGVSQWLIEVQGKNREGITENISFDLEVTSAAPLNVQFLKQESNLQSGKLVFTSTRPLDRIELEAYGDEGQLQWEDKLSPTTAKGGRLKAQFSPREETPRRLEIKVFDQMGSWISFRVAYWYANIPREIVLFESGSIKVASIEVPKLEKARDLISEEIISFRKAMGTSSTDMDIQLYVAGYTDTVGDKSDNLKLSSGRALAISKIFRRLGVKIAIFYAGFGEGALIVQTPDSTDEVRNRRVDYILTNNKPSGLMFPNARWHKLK